MGDFKLHSHGDNWFHFRKDLDSAMESFSVTFCHDGTVCMTGDMGCLVWQREYFPKHLDYGFPSKDTGIGYFAEKVVRASEFQIIMDWTQERAKDDIEEYLHENAGELYASDIATLEEILESIDGYESNGEYGYIQMLEDFNNRHHNLDSETYCGFGRGYTDAFKARFEMLESVSEIILGVVAKTPEG